MKTRASILGVPVLAALAVLAAVVHGGPARAEGTFTLGSTTSTEQSGLLAHLGEVFRRETGIGMRVVAVGTGQALKLAERGDVDAVLVHHRPGEEALVSAGHATDRKDVMHNDFVLVGPAADPAGVAGTRDVVAALARIRAGSAPFVSRGDDSGTHRKEQALWKTVAGGAGVPKGAAWYREVGAGMGQTLNVAAGLDGYTLTDRATWAAFRNRQRLTIVVEGDGRLLNPYGSLLVAPSKGAHIKAREARAWHEWLVSPAGRKAIAAFRIGNEQVFFPAIGPPTQ
jgi:tungstate transport system substrate-binding protein